MKQEFEPMSQKLRVTVLITVLVLLGISWTRQITNSPIEDDAAQMTRMAVNLAHYGVMSVAATPPLYPSMYREPVPVFITALSVKVIDVMQGEAQLSAYLSGNRAWHLKLQNVFWLVLLASATFAAVWMFTSAYWLALAVAVAVSSPLSGSLDSFYTEPAAAALLMLTSLLLSRAIRYGGWQVVAAGFAFGILALIKAAMLYVFVGVTLLLACIAILRKAKVPVRRSMAELGLLLVCFAIIVGPYMYRNYQSFGTAQIAERGGVVLMVRAVKNEMTAEEYRGAFYVWGHDRLKPLLGSLLGFSEKDLQRGGRLQRLNRSYDSDFAAADMIADKEGRPQDAVSFYRRGRAERVKLRKELEAAGSKNAEVDTDKILQARALHAIREHPFKHLATTIPFLWRGAAFAFPIFAVMLGWALYRRRDDLTAFILPAFGMVMFYALLTHFIPRYGVPVLPIAITCGTLAVHAIYRYARPRSANATRATIGA